MADVAARPGTHAESADDPKPPQPREGKPRAAHGGAGLLLAAGALGVVFGDIGTSPLYALQATFTEAVTPDRAGVYGVISLVFWAITLIVSVKYVTFIMRADNEGEGGIMALIARVESVRLQTRWAKMAVIAVGGAAQIAHHPGILRAVSPTYGASFLVEHGGVAFAALGSVVLTVTGAEALYADMGHFGRRPIRRAWFFVVFPALILNYMGQGALILRAPKSVDNPFFLLFPHWARLPMVFLATVATVIASQAVISGAFSVTRQAVQLGFLPRLTVLHTSRQEAGQVYVPAVNWGIFAAGVALVVGVGSAEHLASAYGIAVTGTLAI